MYPSCAPLCLLCSPSVPLVTSGLLRVGPGPHVSPRLPSAAASLPPHTLGQPRFCPTVIQSQKHPFMRTHSLTHKHTPCKSPHSLLLTYVTCPLPTCHWIRRLWLTGALLQWQLLQLGPQADGRKEGVRQRGWWREGEKEQMSDVDVRPSLSVSALPPSLFFWLNLSPPLHTAPSPFFAPAYERLLIRWLAFVAER